MSMAATLVERIPFVIDRRWWLRGEPQSSFMRRSSDNKMCCLGHAGVACGVPRIVMDNWIDPDSVYYHMRQRNLDIPAAFITLAKHPLVGSLMRANDIRIGYRLQAHDDGFLMSEEQRETIITTLLAEIGFDVTFTN